MSDTIPSSVRALLGALALLLLAGCGAEEAASPEAAPTRVAAPARPEGHLDKVDAKYVHGWAWDAANPEETVRVDIYADSKLLGTVAADRFRQDLLAAGKGNGEHAFRYTLPERLQDGESHEFRVEITRAGKELSGSPISVVLDPAGS